MKNWRAVLGFNGEDLDFETVHMRFRELAITLEHPVTLEDLKRLNWALAEARRDLNTSGRVQSAISSSVASRQSRALLASLQTKDAKLENTWTTSWPVRFATRAGKFLRSQFPPIQKTSLEVRFVQCTARHL